MPAAGNRTKRRWNLLLPGGFLLTLLAFLSYFMFFVRFPVTRDFPWANLILFAGAGCLLAIGLWRAFRRPEEFRGKVSGVILAGLSASVFGLFLFFTFYLSSQLPASKGAPRVGQTAPDFSLPDANGRLVSLSGLLSTPIPAQAAGTAGRTNGRTAQWVLLVFYRGYW